MPVGVFQPVNDAYDVWPFYRAMSEAREAGRIRVSCLGMGVDPLTFATDLLTVAVFDADCFDELFGGLVQTNSEGAISLAAAQAGLR